MVFRYSLEESYFIKRSKGFSDFLAHLSTEDRQSTFIEDQNQPDETFTLYAVKKNHPKITDIVDEAIFILGRRRKKGVSLINIKKYMHGKYGINPAYGPTKEKIKEYINSSVEEKKLKRVSGRGASGSFRMSAQSQTKRKIKKKRLSLGLPIIFTSVTSKMKLRPRPKKRIKKANSL